MCRCRLAPLALAFLFLLGIGGAAADPDALAERLRYRLEAPAADALAVATERVHAAPSLRRFYAARLYRPAWVAGGALNEQARALERALEAVAADGLNPADYHLPALRRLRDQPASPGRAVDLELLLTDAYLLAASHLLGGRVDPVTIDSEWHAQRRERDLVAHLEHALTDGDVAEFLEHLRPAPPGYARLKAALAEYRALVRDGGWHAVPAGPALKPGVAGERVAALRARLAATGELADAAGGRFDADVEDAVRAFQRRHGLEADGVAGPVTLAALNVPAAERARQIRLNLERWRWLPQELGERHIRVNIADFRMELWDGGVRVGEQNVVVGRDVRRTPVFSEHMRYLVLNPAWEVPPSLAVQDILPKVKQDPGYLRQMNMQVLQGWGSDERVVDAAGVDWQSLSARRFPYRLRQLPGDNNALGQVKFMFPNRFNVYLHDTPARDLFARSQRALSSGCVRVQDPIALAEWVLAPGAQWSRARIEQAVATGATQTVPLPQRIPVHLQYWTAWTDDAGRVQFRADLYGRDARLAGELTEPAPAAGQDA